jgi:hypothetical protein
MNKIMQAIVSFINRYYIFTFHMSEQEVLEKLLAGYQAQITDEFNPILSMKIDCIQNILDTL